ncbi:MAG: hypothetical protein Q8N65_01145 [bacterium]|nr:hypothetical protein [bacterium]
MKKLFLFSFLLVVPFFVFAHSVSFDQTTGEIMKAQGVSEISDIDCQKATDDQFEVLGDAVMGVMHPNEQDHELMDQMMGGQGSPSLKAAHILMGKRYLGCLSGTAGYGMMSGFGMMGGGMLAPYQSGAFGSGMGTGWGSNLTAGSFWFAWIFQILSLAAIILIIIALVKWVFKK